MNKHNKKAFTMLELTFVIVVIGILSAIAIPKFAMTKDDAHITKAKTTVSSIRNAISMEKQKRILRGNFVAITSLSSASGTGVNIPMFDAFDGNTSNPVLEYPLWACETPTSTNCWIRTGTTYTYNMPVTGLVNFTLNNNRFDCVATDVNCQRLTR